MEDDDRQAMYYEEMFQQEEQMIKNMKEECEKQRIEVKKVSLKSKILVCISNALAFVNDFTDKNLLYNELEREVNQIIDETELFI